MILAIVGGESMAHMYVISFEWLMVIFVDLIASQHNRIHEIDKETTEFNMNDIDFIQSKFIEFYRQ